MSKYRPVIDSYLRCVADEEFIPRFYQNFLSKDAEVKRMFAHVDFTKQHQLLKSGLLSMITYLDQHSKTGKYTFERLRETHGTQGMNIRPEHYQLWKQCMLETIEKTDKDYSEVMGKQWGEVLDVGIYLIQHEEKDLED